MKAMAEHPSIVGGFFYQGCEDIEQNFFKSGTNTFNIALNDEQLRDMIIHIRCVIAFLRGRTDSILTSNALRRELDSYEDMARQRGWETLGV